MLVYRVYVILHKLYFYAYLDSVIGIWMLTQKVTNAHLRLRKVMFNMLVVIICFVFYVTVLAHKPGVIF